MNDVPEPAPQTQPAKPITPPVTRPVSQLKVETPQKSLISAPRTMNFPDAIREIINGNKIRRVSWPDARDYCFFNKKSDYLSIYRGIELHVWTKINSADLEANDWVVVRELK